MPTVWVLRWVCLAVLLALTTAMNRGFLNSAESVQEKDCSNLDFNRARRQWNTLEAVGNRPMCRILTSETLHKVDRSYQFFSKIRSVSSDKGQDYGEVGLAFNAIDVDNFDFVIIRLRNALCSGDDCNRKCIQFGYVEKGKVTMDEADQFDCSLVRLQGNAVYRLRLRIRDNMAVFAINNMNMARKEPKFPLRSGVGIALPGGNAATVNFRDSIVKYL